ncbi:hypothetical protein A2707_05275 [Candidatus Saccharibacteria bacterium RIFCSPHIGHO2_01_FULL_45_15]|nr:MAG: hypothetical protein A2707_05275 [Candidatus Saccharibacteria bacterium RIFCSPHIGHO2_01_FULL_45_15]OGL27411.1 MAG: hypothetical protein A3C39_05215 [Candidatus Saccharibacteria bacterium RIFCSPHIGHO2_02_FULL_46_12]OGL32627.1 MAG: hypothetical protein A3E76_04690 [Candidatus Saccharibacteria bacterium RIFCSPHIGHO2_12_FULL_44_22]
MARQTIAVDVDDVLADHVEAFVAWSNDKYGTDFTVDSYVDYWPELWSISHDQAEERAILFHKERHHRHFVNKSSALPVLKQLQKEYDLVVVTARRESIINDSKEWLSKYYPDIFQDVRFVPIWEKDNTVTKAAICQEVGASYLIDDMLRHCISAAEVGIECLLFGDYNWNKHDALPRGITRVSDWQVIQEYFDAKRA